MPAFNLDGWLAILAYVILGAPALIAAITTLRHARRDKPLRAKVDEIHDQTVNNHGPHGEDRNLREQLDELEDIVRDGFKTVARDIGGLREEMRQERKERARDDDDLSERIVAHERRYHPEPFG